LISFELQCDHAYLILKRKSEEILIDARPSDSVALALRAGTPIFVDESVLDQAGLN